MGSHCGQNSNNYRDTYWLVHRSIDANSEYYGTYQYKIVLEPKTITDGALTALNAFYNDTNAYNSLTQTWTALTGQNGTVNNGTWGTNGAYYLEFDGTSTWVNLGASMETARTLQITFATTAALGYSTHQYLISNIQTGGVQVYIEKNTGYICGAFVVNKDGTNKTLTIKSNIVAQPNQVYDVALTYDEEGNEYLYVNGQRFAYSGNSYLGSLTTPSNNTVMSLGTNPNGSNSGGTMLKGKVYAASVYSRVLTEDEIMHNAKAGFVVAEFDPNATLSTLVTPQVQSTNQLTTNRALSKVKSIQKTNVNITDNVEENVTEVENTTTKTDDEIANDNKSENTEASIDENSKSKNTEATIDENNNKENEVVDLPQIAQINGTPYSTISEALASANSGDTIKLLEDVSLTDEVIIEKEKNVIINLNGKTLTGTSNNTINNKGTLTISGTGIIKNEVENGNVIYNAGILNIESGVITIAKIGGKGIYNDSQIVSSSQGASLNISGGKFVTEGVGAIGIYNSTNNKAVIKNAIVETRGYGGKGVYNDSDVEITKTKIIVADDDSIGIYNSKTSKTCELKEIEITIEADKIENYDLIKNTDQFKEELEQMKPSYGIYNDSDITVNLETGTVKVERLKGVGIINKKQGTIVLGKEDDNMSNATPVIYAIADHTTSIINSEKGTISFYDGRIITLDSIKSIITKILAKHQIFEEISSNIINTTLKAIEDEEFNKGDGSKSGNDEAKNVEGEEVVENTVENTVEKTVENTVENTVEKSNEDGSLNKDSDTEKSTEEKSDEASSVEGDKAVEADSKETVKDSSTEGDVLEKTVEKVDSDK